MLFTKFAPLLLAAAAFAQTFSVNTPAALPQCQPAQIQITGGTAPYILAAIPGGQPTAPAIAQIANNIASSPYVWTVNLAAGLNITLRVTDATGAIAYSYWIVIQAGATNSCLNTSASTSGLSTGGITTTVTTSGTQSGSVSAPATTSTTVPPVSSVSSVSTSVSGSSTSVSTSVSTSRPASSAPASSSAAWAMPTAMAGMPAVAMAALGGVAAFL